MVLKSFKYRIYPTQCQEILLNKHFGCVRFIYNWGLETKVNAYQSEQKKLSCFDLIKMMTQLKTEKEWLSEVNTQSLQSALRNLDNAFTRFFRSKMGFPNFKKKNDHQSYQCPQNVAVNVKASSVRLPKIGSVKCVFDRTFDGKVKTVTVTRSPSYKYFVSILVETSDSIPSKPCISENTTIGIDLGIKHFAVLSNGTKIDNPKFLAKQLKKLRTQQYRLSKKDTINKKKGNQWTNRRQKQKLKVARLHEKISNQRNDFLHKLTHSLTHNNQVNSIAVETLSVKDMMKDPTKSRAIGDCSWSKFIELLTYKCEWYGKNLIKIGRFEPSSKMCSNCGWIKENLQLQDRTWTCNMCLSDHDRDLNAATNIKKFGLVPQNLLEPELRKIGRDTSELTLGKSVVDKTASLSREKRLKKVLLS